MKESPEGIIPIRRGKEIRIERSLERVSGVTKELFTFADRARELVVTARALLEAERRKPQADQDHAVIARLTADLSVFEETERGAMDSLISSIGSRRVLQDYLDRFRGEQDLKGMQERLQELRRESSEAEVADESA